MSIPTVEDPNRKRNGRVGVYVRTPFDESFVEAIKAEIPHGEREWVPSKEAWWVAADYTKTVQDLMLQYWPELMRLGGKEDGAIVSRGGTVVVQERLPL